MDNKRKLMMIILIGVIVITSVMLFINKDSWFRQEAKVEYSDGCVEVYVNKELVTPECYYAKQMIAEQEAKKKKQIDKLWVPNTTIL